MEFNAGVLASVAAENFRIAVTSSAGHDGTITVTVDAGTVRMTQASQGIAGNTTVAHGPGWDAIPIHHQHLLVELMVMEAI